MSTALAFGCIVDIIAASVSGYSFASEWRLAANKSKSRETDKAYYASAPIKRRAPFNTASHNAPARHDSTFRYCYGISSCVLRIAVSSSAGLHADSVSSKLKRETLTACHISNWRHVKSTCYCRRTPMSRRSCCRTCGEICHIVVFEASTVSPKPAWHRPSAQPKIDKSSIGGRPSGAAGMLMALTFEYNILSDAATQASFAPASINNMPSSGKV